MSTTKHNPKADGLAQHFLSNILQTFIVATDCLHGRRNRKGFSL